MEEDRLSTLPDEIVVRIFSYLNMRDVVKTSLLSTAWRNKWVNVLCLNFEGDGESESELFIEEALSRIQSSKIQRISIRCCYTRTIAGRLDSWLILATMRGLEHLIVHFSLEGFDWTAENWYRVPPDLYNCQSLKILDLCLCDLNLPTVVQLSSLKTLILSNTVNFPENTIALLTSNCPVLECLSLIICNSTDDLQISIYNRSLKTLAICEGREATLPETVMTISAPHLQHLKFFWSLPRNTYIIQELSYLVVLSFEDLFPDIDSNKFSEEWQRSGELLGCIGEMCHHLKELNLCNYFVQVLSMRQLQNLKPLSIDANCIILETTLAKWELPGISYLLKSSPKLETLIINSGTKYIKLVDDLKDNFEDYWNRDNYNFSSLRIVEINFYVGSYNFGDEDEVQKRIESSYVGFVSVLLRKATFLERMIIKCGEKDSSLHNDHKSRVKVCQIFSLLPRASQRCELQII